MPKHQDYICTYMLVSTKVGGGVGLLPVLSGVNNLSRQADC